MCFPVFTSIHVRMLVDNLMCHSLGQPTLTLGQIFFPTGRSYQGSCCLHPLFLALGLHMGTAIIILSFGFWVIKLRSSSVQVKHLRTIHLSRAKGLLILCKDILLSCCFSGTQEVASPPSESESTSISSCITM